MDIIKGWKKVFMFFINMMQAFAFSDDILFIFSVGNKVMIV